MGNRAPESANDFESTERTRVRQRASRARYDRETIYRILDEGLVGHVGFVVDGQPYVIPMSYARDGDRLVLHGSPASRLLRTISDGVPVCITVTLVDSLVVAAHTAHHSMNYRSVAILGRGAAVTSEAEKAKALRTLAERYLPGHLAHAHPPTPEEVRATLVVEVPLREASAKIRAEPPLRGEDEGGIWTGEIPLRLVALPAVGRPDESIPLPPSIANYALPGGR